MLKLLEAYLFDESLHACVHRRDIAIGHCVVGVDDITQVDEALAHIDGNEYEQCDDQYIIRP